MNTEPTQATQQPDDPNSVPAGTDVVEGGQEIGPINEQDVPAEHEASTKPEEDYTAAGRGELLLNEDD